MSDPSSNPPSEPPAPRTLRVWPAAVLAALMVAARFGPMAVEDGASRYWMIPVFGPLLGCVLLVVWWLAASRATWRERVFGLLGILASLGVVLTLEDRSMRGPGTSYFTLPTGMLAFAVAMIVLRSCSPLKRTGVGLLATFGVFAISMLLRTEGMSGDYVFKFVPRWAASAEDAWLATSASATPTVAAVAGGAMAAEAGAAEWPGFRGADRSGSVSGVRITTAWNTTPPRRVWKTPVGPGWSSFAVAGRRLYTQEQRGPKETVVCYDADTGKEAWSRGFDARFEEALGGPGPRATPTVGAGGLFVVGSTGLFVRLNPLNGDVVWQVDLATEAQRKLPMWGFSASPLVAGDAVIVYAGGPGQNGVIGFDPATGKRRWGVAAGIDSYSSPHPATVAGESVVLMLTNDGLLAIEPKSGSERLRYDWKFMNYRALQPQLGGNDTVVLPTGMNVGTRAIHLVRTNGAFNAEELWTSKNLKPDFSDSVIHDGHIYGADGGIFTCVDLKTGERRWKGGRYGKGQALLLRDAALILIAAESGEVVLLKADPKEWAELGRFKAIEGKTWNHPVVVGDRLYLRNSQEAACYQLDLATAAR